MIHLQDARKFLPFIPDNSVDLVVTDPPYPVISGGNQEANAPQGILKKNDGKIFKHNDISPVEYMADLYRILRPSSHIYVFTNFLNLETTLDFMRSEGFGIHNLLVWRKQNATPNRWYMKNVEYVIMGRKGKAKAINDCGSMTCHDFKNPTGNKEHPTEKPVDLLRYYIENSTKPDGLVLDPFAGSGSTGVACQQSGRKFLGCEIDTKYHAIACRRMKIMPI